MSGPPLSEIRREAAGCTACDLYARATQTVFGEGPPDARMMLVGEQPGDHEDREGHPFVGPAGQLLDRALQEAQIDRDEVYVTNAVKHFKWRPAGKVRLHQKPNAAEIRACSRWWKAELDSVQPTIVVLLGATAAQAVLGPKVRVDPRPRADPRGPGRRDAGAGHDPSLRDPADEAAERDEGFAALVRDLVVAAEQLARR